MAHVEVGFGDCELSIERIELRRAGKIVDMEPQVFDVLAYLLRHRERVVPKAAVLIRMSTPPSPSVTASTMSRTDWSSPVSQLTAIQRAGRPPQPLTAPPHARVGATRRHPGRHSGRPPGWRLR